MKPRATSLLILAGLVLCSVPAARAATPSVRTTQGVYAAGETITVQYAGFPGNGKDWITLVKAGESPSIYGPWAYTHGQAAGTMRFGGLPEGDYEVRAFFDWPDGGYQVRARAAFQVTASPGGGGDDAGIAAYYYHTGIAHYDKGEYPEALENHQRSLAIRQRALGENHPDVASSHDQMGRVYLAMGDPARALASHRRARDLWLAAYGGEHFNVALARLGMAMVYDSLGDADAALECYRAALPVFERERSPNTGICHHGLAGILHARGDLAGALEHYRRAEEIFVAEWSEQHENVAVVRLAVGWILKEQGDFAGALGKFNQVLASRRAIYGDRHPDLARALEAIGLLEQARRDLPAALDRFRAALEPLHLSPGPWDGRSATLRPIPLTVDILFRLSGAEEQDGCVAPRERLRRALATAELGLDVLARLRTGLSREGRQYQEERFRDLPARVLRLRRELERLGDPPNPEKTLRAAEMAAAWSFLELMAEARVNAAGAIPGELAATERELLERSRRLAGGSAADTEAPALDAAWDGFIARLDREYPRYAALKYPRPARLEELRRCLAPDEAALEYVVSPEGAFLVAVSGETFAFVALGDRETVAELAARVRGAIASPGRQDGEAVGDSAASHGDPLAELYRELLAPVAPVIAGRALLVVPADCLAAIPFEAGRLPDGRYAGEAYRITYAPALATLVLQRAWAAAAPATADRLLALGDPLYDTAAMDDQTRTRAALYSDTERSGWAPLPGTGTEVVAIAAFFGAGEERLLTAGEATEARVLDLDWREYGYLHFACHGALEAGAGREPALVLSLVGNPPGYDGFLTLSEIAARPHRARVTVLSACNTGRPGDALPKTGVSSLARAFLLTGSDYVVVSLWSVSDEATARLMKRFYRGLREEHLPPDEALRRAQASLRRSARFAAPYYWAPFILAGK